MFTEATLLITGGTGSFGNAFVKSTLDRYHCKRIVVYSRDEMKQWEMKKKYVSESRIKFVIGDVRDYNRLSHSLEGVDYVIHAAAMKIVPTAEYNPEECIKTNILGAMNIIDACKEHRIKRCVALSTDKACLPVNLYGATKLCSDKLFVAANKDNIRNSTKFSLVRYGNVFGSRGSVVHLFLEQAKKGHIFITDERMTRFLINLEDAVKLVWRTFDLMKGGEIFVKKCPSIKIVDLARILAPDAKITRIGIRPGEKLHECLISNIEASYTYENHEYFIIIPQLYNCEFYDTTIGVPVPDDFCYSSNTNGVWLPPTEMKKWMARAKI